MVCTDSEMNLWTCISVNRLPTRKEGLSSDHTFLGRPKTAPYVGFSTLCQVFMSVTTHTTVLGAHVSPPFHRCRHGGPENFKNLPNFSQSESGSAETPTQVSLTPNWCFLLLGGHLEAPQAPLSKGAGIIHKTTAPRVLAPMGTVDGGLTGGLPGVRRAASSRGCEGLPSWLEKNAPLAF